MVVDLDVTTTATSTNAAACSKHPLHCNISSDRLSNRARALSFGPSAPRLIRTLLPYINPDMPLVNGARCTVRRDFGPRSFWSGTGIEACQSKPSKRLLASGALNFILVTSLSSFCIHWPICARRFPLCWPRSSVEPIQVLIRTTRSRTLTSYHGPSP